MNRFYRNHSDITSIEGILVDAQSLWKYDPKQDLLILEDADQYCTTPLTDMFEESN